jgi:3-oxoacyl-[acyl-carrier-protein] synthase III
VKNVKIVGYGHYLPERFITNHELSQSVDTSDEWIVTRTGIKKRHIAAEHENTSDLATQALRNALNGCDMDAKNLDGIILATTTPDLFLPSTATIVQNNIGLEGGFAFDVQAVCTGFIYALNIAYSMIRCGQAKSVAVLGAETMSRIIDWRDRNTCVLFGDGAGAVIVSQAGSNEDGIIDIEIAADGRCVDMLNTKGGIAAGNLGAKLQMDGKAVFKFAVDKMETAVQSILKKNSISAQQLDWLVPHQANYRIIKSISEKMTFEMNKIAVTVDIHANTSAASIPLALSHYIAQGLILKGNLVAITAVGAGMTWGAGLFVV